jgi:hypothetical protein
MVDHLGSSMSRPDPSDNVSDYAPRGPSEFYRQGRAGAAEGEGFSPKGDLSRLRQSLGPQPEVVHVPQPSRRLGWFASGFMIALAVGVVVGWLVIAEFPSLSGKAPGSSTKTTEFAPRFDNSKSPEEANSPLPNTPASPRVSSSPPASAPVASPSAQPANSAPRLATVGPATEPAPKVRGVTDSEIRFGISAPFSGPAKELGQNIKLGIESAFNVANAKGGVYGRQLRLVAADDEPARAAATMTQLYEKDQVFGLIGNVGRQRRWLHYPTRLIARCCFSEPSLAPAY